MTSPYSCVGVPKFNPNIDPYLYFSDSVGPVVDACRYSVQNSPAEISVAAAVAVGGMRHFKDVCADVCPQNSTITDSEPLLSSMTASATFDPPSAPATAANAPRPSTYSDRTKDKNTPNIRIDEVEGSGKYIRLTNDSCSQDEEIGCNVLRQAYQGHAIIEFHFPPRVIVPAGSSVTVWSCGNKEEKNDEPHWNFYFKELFRWASGPDYVTSLNRANGQLVVSTQLSAAFGFASEKPTGPSPGIISKFNLISNRYILKRDREKALANRSMSAELIEFLKKKSGLVRFKPRVIRSNGMVGKPMGGVIRQSLSQADPCLHLIYP